MSLISDALKTAQRERGKARGSGDPSPMIDGFFPYVSSAPRPRRSRKPVVAISVAGVALLAVAAWLSLPALTGPRTETKTPIVLPPPLAQAPMVRDTTLPPIDTGRAASSTVAAVSESAGAPVITQAPVSTPAMSTGSSPRPAGAATPPPAVRATEPAVERSVEPAVPVVRREAAPPPDRVDFEAQAAALFNAGDLVGAREKFVLATRNAPTARAWTNYGVTLQRLGDLGGASAAYQSAIGIDANYLEAWLYQGRLAVLLGDVAKAIPLFQRARAINPRHAEVNVELARLEADAKNWTEARRFAVEAVRADPANSQAHWYLAVSADQLRDIETARREYAAYLQTVGAAERDQAQFVGWARQRIAELRGKL